ncbi:hypothetical protein [Croceicoccus marinus]|uniref:hypothetical protein n=1 Tax=Croceicoccus marinus TaxID=450378 RepID=UPI001FD2A29B|nr:hypothetical protein [Croceicoccus marinus]
MNPTRRNGCLNHADDVPLSLGHQAAGFNLESPCALPALRCSENYRESYQAYADDDDPS